MDRARIEELWSRFLSGADLPAGEEEQLADALEADPRLLAELSQDLKLDGSLRGLGHVARDEDEFVDSFSYRLRTERDGTRFIATVKQKMKRSRRPPTRRWETTGWPAARLGFAAAVVIAVLVLILAASSSTPPPKPESARRPVDRVERPVPPPPTPLPEPRRPEPVPSPVDDTPLTPKTFSAPIEKKEKPSPPPVIVENPKPAPSTVGAPPRPLVAVGTLGRVNGDVIVSSADVKAPAKAGQKLFAGQAVESTGAKSGAQVMFADGTRIDLGADTLVSDVADARGKRITLARGQLNAEVTKQPADQPMIVSTPHGEAKVLGTVFRLSVEGGTMRLEVKEGRVRLTRASDLKAVDVPAGCFATAGDLDLNADNKVTVSFQDGVSPTPRYAGTSDVTIVEAAKLAEKNNAAHQLLWVDGDTTVGDDRCVLLRWDLAGLPPRCTVISATLEIQVTNDSKGTTFDLYEIRRDWIEKDVTWKFAAAKSPWQIPGAQGALDRSRAVLGILSPNQSGLHSVKLTPEGIAVVQSWIDAPATNHGFIIANPDNQDAIGFHSREASLPANRPRLNISFIPRAK